MITTIEKSLGYKTKSDVTAKVFFKSIFNAINNDLPKLFFIWSSNKSNKISNEEASKKVKEWADSVGLEYITIDENKRKFTFETFAWPATITIKMNRVSIGFVPEFK